ncbi:MAG: hypothetical protein RMK52_06685 [Chitinophagales bacterium]|nr:hypothetical protein [Chitinophagales bacterium]MDW8393914.1 hypothetical protein [Chitinophagales bacterium]
MAFCLQAGEVRSQADLFVEQFAVHFDGDPDWTSISLKVINKGTLPACCNMDVGIYVGKTALLIPSQLLFYLKAGFFLYANDTTELDTVFNFCDSLLLSTIPNTYRGPDPIFIGYSVDPHDKVVELNESNNAGIFGQPLYLTCAVGLSDPPQDAISFSFNAEQKQCWISIQNGGHIGEVVILNLFGQQMPVSVQQQAQGCVVPVHHLPPSAYVALVQQRHSTKRAAFRFTIAD